VLEGTIITVVLNGGCGQQVLGIAQAQREENAHHDDQPVHSL
jgi:hypothetical protein